MKIKIYLKDLFSYLKNLSIPKKILLFFFILLNLIELVCSISALLGLYSNDYSPFNRIYSTDIFDYLLDYRVYYSAFVSFTYFLITILLKKFNYLNCIIIALLLSMHPIVSLFIGWFPMIMEDIFG
jgi:hypothetical protein